MVSPFQIGFIPSRSIHENIIIAHEICHSFHKTRGKSGFFAIKVDLAKPLDRLRWSFIYGILVEISFPQVLINFIMNRVSSVKTNVSWNGSRSEFFSPIRGVRQGDPLSPYFFVLCMDKLFHLISHQVDIGVWIPPKAKWSSYISPYVC